MTDVREWSYDGRHGRHGRLAARTWSPAQAPDHVVLLAHGDGLAAVALSAPLISRTGPIDTLLGLDEIPDVPLDITTLSRDPAVGEAYAADPLVWHGPFTRPTVEALGRAVDAVQAGPSLGALPLLWLHGEHDQLVPMAGAREGRAVLRGSSSEERTSPQARHEVFNELEQDEVIGDVVHFLRRALTGT